MATPKGVSGNPAGLSREQARARGVAQRLAAKHVEDAMRVQIAVMLDETASPQARVNAAQAVLDRGAGKVPAPIEHGGGVVVSFVIETPMITIDADEWQRQQSIDSLAIQ